MFDTSPVIVGLEVGTSKICAVVGEVNPDSAGLSIIGLGQARSRGVRKGEIVDAALAGEDIRNAIVEAEQMADVEVRSVYLGVTGGHIRGFNNRGVHPVVSADREQSGVFYYAVRTDDVFGRAPADIDDERAQLLLLVAQQRQG